jgi:hypothetical protein
VFGNDGAGGSLEIGSDVLLKLKAKVSLDVREKKTASVLMGSENSCYVIYRVSTKKCTL